MSDAEAEPEAEPEPDDNAAVTFSGPPEPVAGEGDEQVQIMYPTDTGGITSADLGTWVCKLCGVETSVKPGPRGEVETPHQCEGCERNGPFRHKGAGDNPDVVETAAQAGAMWRPPTAISDEGYDDLWSDVHDYIYDHWDAGDGEEAEAIYAGLTAYALSTWIRENLTFVPHLMLRGHTTGGKTRLLNTLARVSYRAVVSASATPASMYRMIDGYNVTYYVSEYHGLDPDTRRELDNVVRAGQKRGEVVTRAEPTSDGHEPMAFDPFSHAAIATQYEPSDDIVNRCIQVTSSTSTRDMPATHDEPRATSIRNRLLYARYRLLESAEWDRAEDEAYDYLASRGIDGRTREKLLSLLTVALHWGRLYDLDPFIDLVVEQDQGAAADSEDALFVEAVRDLAFGQLAETAVLGDGDPFAALEIPYSDVVDRYEEVTGVEKSASWAGHVVKRLGFEKKRKRGGTVIADPELGDKLRSLCNDLNLEWERLEGDRVIPIDDGHRATCPGCDEMAWLDYQDTITQEPLCEDCAADRNADDVDADGVDEVA